MTLNDGWATVAVRFVGSNLEAAIPSTIAERASINTAGTVISFPLADGQNLSLQALTSQAVEFINKFHAELTELSRSPGVLVDLFVGWSPRAPQESAVFDRGLVELLADLNASVVFDTYSDDQE